LRREARLRIAIVGGGIAGLAAASLLARHGHRITLFEKQAALHPCGAGILLQPVALRVLDELQALDAMRSHAAQIEHFARYAPQRHDELQLHYHELAPQLHGLGVARADLVAALLARARSYNVDLRLGADVLGLQQDTEQVQVLGVDCREANVGFDAAIVCNGALSKLRAHQCLPATLTHNAWGVCTALIESPTCHSQRTVFQWQLDSDNYFGLLPVSPGCACLFWNVRTAALERMTQQDFASWRSRIGSIHPELAAATATLHGFQDFRFNAFTEVRMPRWHVGRIVFIGDAAHATNPQLGMGANMALVDAATLATYLEGAAGSEIPAALKMYQRTRERQLRFYERASRAMTLLANPDGLLARAAQRSVTGVLRRSAYARRRVLTAVCGYAGDLLVPL
jgi:2-polyprenyl-6-methoxyphenol hydroxylase-like FAD-dependent oxidoreductase